MRTRYPGVMALSIALKLMSILAVIVAIQVFSDAGPLLRQDFLLFLATVLSPVLNIFAYYATGELFALYAGLAAYAEDARYWLHQDQRRYEQLGDDLNRVLALVQQRGQLLERWQAARPQARPGPLPGLAQEPSE